MACVGLCCVVCILALHVGRAVVWNCMIALSWAHQLMLIGRGMAGGRDTVIQWLTALSSARCFCSCCSVVVCLVQVHWVIPSAVSSPSFVGGSAHMQALLGITEVLSGNSCQSGTQVLIEDVAAVT